MKQYGLTFLKIPLLTDSNESPINCIQTAVDNITAPKISGCCTQKFFIWIHQHSTQKRQNDANFFRKFTLLNHIQPKNFSLDHKQNLSKTLHQWQKILEQWEPIYPPSNKNSDFENAKVAIGSLQETLQNNSSSSSPSPSNHITYTPPFTFPKHRRDPRDPDFDPFQSDDAHEELVGLLPPSPTNIFNTKITINSNKEINEIINHIHKLKEFIKNPNIPIDAIDPNKETNQHVRATNRMLIEFQDQHKDKLKFTLLENRNNIIDMFDREIMSCLKPETSQTPTPFREQTPKSTYSQDSSGKSSPVRFATPTRSTKNLSLLEQGHKNIDAYMNHFSCAIAFLNNLLGDCPQDYAPYPESKKPSEQIQG